MKGHIRKYTLKAGAEKWAAVVYRGKRFDQDGKLRHSYQWVRGFETEKAAAIQLRKILTSIDNNTYVEPLKQNLYDYLDRWLNTTKANLAPKTFERYKQLVDVNIRPRLGVIQLAELQPSQLAEFYAWSSAWGNRRTGKGLNPQTVLHIHRLLRKALHQAVVWRLRASNPADAVDAPRVQEREIQPVDQKKAALLMEAAEETNMFIPILTGFCTGMRRGEILALRWSDFDQEGAKLTIQQSLTETRSGGLAFKSPKNRSSRRTISIPQILVKALVAHRHMQETNKDLFGPDYADFDLIVPLPDGSPWAPDRFTAAYICFAKKNGAKGVRFHDLRHTHASELLRRGIPVKTVARRLGHASTKITLDTYAHLMSGDDEKAAQLTQEVYGNMGRRR